MFFATYKASIKTLLRSLLVWLAFALAVGVVIYNTMRISHGYVEMLPGGGVSGMIWDTDPRYVLGYDRYIGLMYNLNGKVMLYAMPLFTVITAMVMMIRTHDDNFFEIEKAGGVSTATYFWGRIAALVTVNFVVLAVLAYLNVDLYYFTRGGLKDFTTMEFFRDSFVRVGRVLLFCMLPGMLFYLALTVAISSLIKNGIAGGVVGLAMVLVNYMCATVLMLRIPGFVGSFLDPSPQNLYNYWGFFDTEWSAYHPIMNAFTTKTMILCICIILGTSAVLGGISLLVTKKRTR